MRAPAATAAVFVAAVLAGCGSGADVAGPSPATPRATSPAGAPSPTQASPTDPGAPVDTSRPASPTRPADPVLPGPGDGRAPAAPSPPGGDPAVRPPEPAEVVTPQPGTRDPRPRMFERITVDQQAQTATVYYWTGVEPCYVLDRVEVEPREDTVVVTVFEGSNAGPDTSCIQLARFVRTTFELPEPIAGRTIIDGATGQPVT